MWRGISLLSRDAAKLPCFIYRAKGKGKTKATDLPAYPLLRRKPNPMMTVGIWKQVMMLHAILRGNGYSYINRKGNGDPFELLLLDPDRTEPMMENGKLIYKHRMPANVDKIFQPEDVFHLKGLGYDGIKGYDLVQYAKDAIGIGVGSRKYGAVFFRNNARPNIALEVPGRLKEPARINMRESWERAHSGLENQHRVALLEEGVKLVQFSQTAREAQLQELRQFERGEVALILGVPLHKLGDRSQVSYNSLEQSNQEYLDEGLDPWLCAIEEEAHDKLLTEEQKDSDGYMVSFDRRQLLRANLAARATANVAYVNSGILNRDEAREDEGYDPIPDGSGQEFRVSANTLPADEEQEEPAEGAGPQRPGEKTPPAKPSEDNEPKKKALAAAHRQVLQDTLGRMARRLTLHARRASSDGRKFMSWLDSFREEHMPVIAEALDPAMRANTLATGYNGFRQTGSLAADHMTEHLRERLLNVAGEATAKDLAAKVDAACTQWETSYPATVAEELTR